MVPSKSNIYVVNEPKHSASNVGLPPNTISIANDGSNDSNKFQPYLHSGSLLIR